MVDQNLSKKELKRSRQSGQVFIEFIMLLVVLTALSYTMLYGVNSGVSSRWQQMVHLVTKLEGSAPPQFQ